MAKSHLNGSELRVQCEANYFPIYKSTQMCKPSKIHNNFRPKIRIHCWIRNRCTVCTWYVIMKAFITEKFIWPPCFSRVCGEHSILFSMRQTAVSLYGRQVYEKYTETLVVRFVLCMLWWIIEDRYRCTGIKFQTNYATGFEFSSVQSAWFWRGNGFIMNFMWSNFPKRKLNLCSSKPQSQAAEKCNQSCFCVCFSTFLLSLL